MDFTGYPLSNKLYAGSERKIGIVIDGIDYMLKFQKYSAFGKRNNHLSEYIGSHIFAMIGFETQETYLGTYEGEQVVACRNFISNTIQFVPFNDVGESSLEQDRNTYQYSYEDIMQMLKDNAKLANVKETIRLFWDMYIVDALLGNFDRHGANWGFLKENNIYRPAPVFDNGSCLFPQMTDEDMMKKIIASEEETNRRVYSFPTSQIKLGNNKSSYSEVIRSLEFAECNNALLRIKPMVDLVKINDFIDSIDQITEVHKKFYKHMIENRYKKILADAYERLNGSI